MEKYMVTITFCDSSNTQFIINHSQKKLLEFLTDESLVATDCDVEIYEITPCIIDLSEDEEED